MVQTNYGSISQRTAMYAADQMLEHARPVIVLGDYLMAKPLPKNKADTIAFRQPVPFPVAKNPTPLVEGTTPDAHGMSYIDVKVTLKQYGGVVEITDVVNDLAEDPVLKDASMLSGEEAGETIEAITWGVLQAGASVVFPEATDAVTDDVNHKITRIMQRTVTRYLKRMKAKKIRERLAPSTGYSTVPVDNAFVAVGHTDLESDLRDMDGFRSTEYYGSYQPLPYEIGRCEDVRYVLSPALGSTPDAGGAPATNGVMSTTGTNADIYPIVYLGRNCAGHVPLRGARAITPSVINPDQVSKSDPLGQRGYVGWKCYFACLILNDTWMCRGEVAVSVLNEANAALTTTPNDTFGI